MLNDLTKYLKTFLWALVIICLVKVYEHSGFTNPNTLAVICLVFSLWFLFRIELNEDVEDHNERNEQTSSPTSSVYTHPSSTRTLHAEDLHHRSSKKKKLSKFSRLVRSRSNTPSKSEKTSANTVKSTK